VGFCSSVACHGCHAISACAELFVIVLCTSEKDIEDDQYLVPCALYESAMVHLAAERYMEAKDLLTRAKY